MRRSPTNQFSISGFGFSVLNPSKALSFSSYRHFFSLKRFDFNQILFDYQLLIWFIEFFIKGLRFSILNLIVTNFNSPYQATVSPEWEKSSKFIAPNS